MVTSKTPLWYLTRATGLVAMVLLTASMAFGLLSSVRYQRPGWPRFVTAGLHRNASLLACAFTVIHIVTTLADGFVPISLADVAPYYSRVEEIFRVTGCAYGLPQYPDGSFVLHPELFSKQVLARIESDFPTFVGAGTPAPSPLRVVAYASPVGGGVLDTSHIVLSTESRR